MILPTIVNAPYPGGQIEVPPYGVVAALGLAFPSSYLPCFVEHSDIDELKLGTYPTMGFLRRELAGGLEQNRNNIDPISICELKRQLHNVLINGSKSKTFSLLQEPIVVCAMIGSKDMRELLIKQLGGIEQATRLLLPYPLLLQTAFDRHSLRVPGIENDIFGNHSPCNRESEHFDSFVNAYANLVSWSDDSTVVDFGKKIEDYSLYKDWFGLIYIRLFSLMVNNQSLDNNNDRKSMLVGMITRHFSMSLFDSVNNVMTNEATELQKRIRNDFFRALKSQLIGDLLSKDSADLLSALWGDHSNLNHDDIAAMDDIIHDLSERYKDSLGLDVVSRSPFYSVIISLRNFINKFGFVVSMDGNRNSIPLINASYRIMEHDFKIMRHDFKKTIAYKSPLSFIDFSSRVLSSVSSSNLTSPQKDAIKFLMLSESPLPNPFSSDYDLQVYRSSNSAQAILYLLNFGSRYLYGKVKREALYTAQSIIESTRLGLSPDEKLQPLNGRLLQIELMICNLLRIGQLESPSPLVISPLFRLVDAYLNINGNIPSPLIEGFCLSTGRLEEIAGDNQFIQNGYCQRTGRSISEIKEDYQPEYIKCINGLLDNEEKTSLVDFQFPREFFAINNYRYSVPADRDSFGNLLMLYLFEKELINEEILSSTVGIHVQKALDPLKSIVTTDDVLCYLENQFHPGAISCSHEIADAYRKALAEYEAIPYAGNTHKANVHTKLVTP